MLEIIKADLYRYRPFKYSLSNLIIGFRSQGFRYMFFKRLKDHYGKKTIVGIIAKIFKKFSTWPLLSKVSGMF